MSINGSGAALTALMWYYRCKYRYYGHYFQRPQTIRFYDADWINMFVVCTVLRSNRGTIGLNSSTVGLSELEPREGSQTGKTTRQATTPK